MSAISKEIFEVTLAALLHDIGKPLQRAARGDYSTLSTLTRGMAGLVGKNGESYAHALWTCEFFENKEVADFLFNACDLKNIQELANLACRHHNPDAGDTAQAIIQLADWASAGTDREPPDEQEQEHVQKNRMPYYEKPLESIFSRLTIDKRPLPGPHFYKAAGLHDHESLHPSRDEKPISYSAVTEGFRKEFLSICARRNNVVFIDAVASLIVKWFSCIPSSTVEDHADIPLSDHLTTTAAIAAALTRSYELTRTPPGWNTPMRLVSGDVSGIQNFIFSMSGESNRHIAKLIRGRSFMVNLYSVLAARLITDSCGLPALCCLNVAGGRFTVLVPDTPQTRDAVASTGKAIERWTYNRFFGDLKIVVDEGEPFPLSGFNIARFKEVQEKTAQRITGEKERCFIRYLAETPGHWIDNVRWESFTRYGACRICGREPAGADNTGENCKKFIETGTALTKETILYAVNGSDGIFGKYRIEFGIPVDESTVEACWMINPHLTGYGSGGKIRPELHYANKVPITEPPEESNSKDDGDEISCKTFEEMAKTATGLEALAVLKADVDNAGYLFSEGFGDSRSLSRQVALSRMLNWFFAGKLPGILKKDGYANVYTVFAGGDDLCLIGPWDKMLELASEIRSEFARYTANNPSFTISAGISLFKPGFPVARAVECAEEEIKKAKDNGRNRISVFQCPMLWENEFQEQMKFAKDWIGLTREIAEDKEHPRKWNTMLYRFLKYWQKYNDSKTGTLEKLSHRFRFIYDIRRNVPKPKKEGDPWLGKREPLKSLQADLVGHENFENRSLFKNLKVGITIAMYKTRDSKSNEKQLQKEAV